MLNSAHAHMPRQTQKEMSLAVRKIPKTTDQIVRIECAIMDNILFKDLEQAQKNQLYETMFEKSYDKGTDICKQGEDGDHYYIIDDGTVDFVVDGKTVGAAKAGDSFGELALMYFAPRAATCRASSAVTCWCMDRHTFRSFVLTSNTEKRGQQKEFLKTVELLKPLEEYERGKIADVLESVEFNAGDEIITQGDEGDALYFLASSLATAVKDGEKVFEYTEPGQFFGELALMSNQPRAATVEAKGGETLVLKLGRQQFERLVGSCQEVLQRQAQKYLNIGSASASAGPAAPAGATFDMDDEPTSTAGSGPTSIGNAGLEARNAALERENAALKNRVMQLEAELAARPSEGIPPKAISSSSIAAKVEESRRARERLAALLNLPDEN